jgi:hypothetical protein
MSGYFGDFPTRKEDNTLWLCFQNIGGIPSRTGQAKDDYLQTGINKYDIDIMGITETNVSWDNIPETDRLYNRTKHWWRNSHLITANNLHTKEQTKKQCGG